MRGRVVRVGILLSGKFMYVSVSKTVQRYAFNPFNRKCVFRVVYCTVIKHYCMTKNVPITGFIIGLLLPCVGVLIMYQLWGSGEGISQFVHTLTRLRGMASKVLTLSLLINLAPFLYFTTKRLDYAARGVFIATMLYALLVIFIKVIW